MAKTISPVPAKITKKKSAASTVKPAKDGIGIKYSDKSGDQPELVPVFDHLRKLLMPYGKGSITIRGGTGGQLALVVEKPIEVAGKIRNELWFAAALIQKGYVGFYFMPPATASEKKQLFKPALWKCLKGKSCFHIKKMDPEMSEQIEEALKKGYAIFKDKGWA